MAVCLVGATGLLGLTVMGLKFSVLGTVTFGKRCSWRLAGTGGHRAFPTKSSPIGLARSKWGPMGITLRKKGRSL